jgi:hypothetical protein
VELHIIGEDGEDGVVVEDAKGGLKVDVIKPSLAYELAVNSTELLQVNLSILLEHSRAAWCAGKGS